MVSVEGKDDGRDGAQAMNSEGKNGEVAEGQVREDEDDEFGARKLRICKRPDAPTKIEVEEHNRTHAEYRSWCPHCVRGKSISMQHRRGDPDEEKLGVTVSIDHAFKTAERRR